MAYTCYLLSEESKAELMEIFPPTYKNVIAHHITHHFGRSEPLPPEAEIFVIGHVAHGGVEALVVEVHTTIMNDNGDLQDVRRYRNDNGNIYHITWSLTPGRRPVDSNSTIAAHGFNPLAEKIRIVATPASF